MIEYGCSWGDDSCICKSQIERRACRYSYAEMELETSNNLYRNYHIHFDPPPIPYRGCDWHYYHENFDGTEDNRHGDCASEQACKDEIDELLADDGYEQTYKLWTK